LQRKKSEDCPRVVKYRFDESYTPRPLTTKESFKETFRGSADTHTVSYDVAVTIPTVIVVGKPYPIRVKLVIPATEMVIPDFSVNHVRAHLKASNYIRVDGSLFGDHIKEFEDKIPLIESKPGLGVELPPNEDKIVNGVFPTRIYAPHSFSTICINRSYGLTLHVGIKCLDEQKEVSFRWPIGKITLLPSRMEDGVEEAAEMIKSGAFGISKNPPAFAEAVAGPSDAPPPALSEDIAPPTYKESGGNGTQGSNLFGDS